MTPADVLPTALRDTLANGTAEERLALRNLASETRLTDKDIDDFRFAVAGASTPDDLVDAARKVIRRLPADRGTAVGRAGDWFNHLVYEVLYDRGLLDGAPPTPPVPAVAEDGRPVTVRAEYFSFAPGNPRSLWISPFTDGDADAVADQLGLAHLTGTVETTLLRLPIPVGDPDTALFRPSVLDAEARWYWRGPSMPGAPWGVTRQTSDCTAGHPELIATVVEAPRTVKLVGPLSAKDRNGCLGGAP
ncbi:MAG: hypothetical protein ACKVVT_11115 [Dehalococcoidia bacterium]